MAAAVARQKRDFLARQLPDDVNIRRLRPTGFRSRSSCASNPGIEYNPLPPIIPMVGFMPV